MPEVPPIGVSGLTDISPQRLAQTPPPTTLQPIRQIQPEPPRQVSVQLVEHDIGAGREITYFTGTGQRGGVTTAGGTFYSIGGQPGDVLFRSPAEAQAYAATKGQQITSQVGVSDVPSSKYWEQKQAEEARREASYGGVRTETALAPIGEPVPGSQLAMKKEFLQSTTAQWGSGEQFKAEVQAVGQYVPVSATGRIVTPGYPSADAQLKAMQDAQRTDIIWKPPPSPESIKEHGWSGITAGYVITPQTKPLGRTEFDYVPVDLNYLLGTPEAIKLTQEFRAAMPRFQVQSDKVIETFAYNQGIFLTDMFGGKTEVKPGMRYVRDMFGFTSELPMETGAPKVTEEQAAAIRFSVMVGRLGAFSGVGVLTTTAGLRGATLIQPGEIAEISRSFRLSTPKIFSRSIPQIPEYSYLSKSEQESILRSELVSSIQQPRGLQLFRRSIPETSRYGYLSTSEQSEALRAELVKNIQKPKGGSIFEQPKPQTTKFSYLSREQQLEIERQEIISRYTKTGMFFSRSPTKTPEFSYLPKIEQESILRGEVVKGIRGGTGIFTPSASKVPEFSYMSKAEQELLLRQEVKEGLQGKLFSTLPYKSEPGAIGYYEPIRTIEKPKVGVQEYPDLIRLKPSGKRAVSEREVFPTPNLFMLVNAPNALKEMQNIINMDITKQAERTELRDRTSMGMISLMGLSSATGYGIGQPQATGYNQALKQLDTLIQEQTQITQQRQELIQVTPDTTRGFEISRPPETPQIRFPIFEEDNRRRKGKPIISREKYFQTFRAVNLIQPLQGVKNMFKMPVKKTYKKSKKSRRR